MKNKLIRNSLVLAISQAVALYARATPPIAESCTVESASDSALEVNGAKTFRGCLTDVANATAGADFTIEFAPWLKGSTITFDAENQTPTNSAAFALAITGSETVGRLTIDGDIDNDNTPDITLAGGDRLDTAGEDVRTLLITTTISGDVTLDGLHLTGGQMAGASGTSYTEAEGAALLFNGQDANFTLKNSVISGNISGGNTTDQCANNSGDSSVTKVTSRNALISNTTLSDNLSCDNFNTLSVSAKYGDNTDDGQLSLNNVLINNNQGVGAVLAGQIVSVSNSRIENNVASTGNTATGAFIYALNPTGASLITVSDSSIANNGNGGLFTISAGALPQVLIERSSITGNGSLNGTTNKYLGGLTSFIVGIDNAQAEPSTLPSSRLQIVNSTVAKNTGAQIFALGVKAQESTGFTAGDGYIDVAITNSTIIGGEVGVDDALIPSVIALGSLKYGTQETDVPSQAINIGKVSVNNSIITGTTNAEGSVGASCLITEKYEVTTNPGDPDVVPAVDPTTEKYVAILPALGRANIVSNIGTTPTPNDDDIPMLGSSAQSDFNELSFDSCGSASFAFANANAEDTLVIAGAAQADPGSLEAVLDTSALIRFNGITQFFPLANGSAAIDAGDNDSATYKPPITPSAVTDGAVALTTDQLGFARPENPGLTGSTGIVDIGAFEAFSSGIAEQTEEASVPGTGNSATGDGNNDGDQDDTQDDVTSLVIRDLNGDPIYTEASDSYSTLVALDAQNSNNPLLLNVAGWNTLATPSAPEGDAIPQPPPPAGVAFPLGGLSFITSGLSNGGTADFELYVPASSAVTTLYKQVGVDMTWAEVPNTRTVIGNKIKFTFSLADGGQFDVDGIENGTIVDPIYPVGPPLPTPPAPALSATPVPVLPLYGLPILGALLALIGWRAARVRR